MLKKGRGHITQNSQVSPPGVIPYKKLKFSVKYFFSKCDRKSKNLRIWSHLLNKFIKENFTFCTVSVKEAPKFLPLFRMHCIFLAWLQNCLKKASLIH